MNRIRRTTAMLAAAIGVLLCSAASRSLAAVIRVPADKPTIQAALSAAQDGDQVLVIPGVYREALFFPSRSISLSSKTGEPATTIIEGGGTDSLGFIEMEPGAGGRQVIEGFTFQNGPAGIEDPWRTGSPDLVIRNNVFRNISPVGAVIKGAGGLTLTDNQFIHCTGGNGGALWTAGNATIQRNLFTENVNPAFPAGVGEGGAIRGFAFYGPISIEDNEFRSNYAATSGGAIAIVSDRARYSITISGNRFFRNGAGTGGGALFFYYSSGRIEGNRFFKNSAATGAALQVAGSGCVVTSNTIVASEGGTGSEAVLVEAPVGSVAFTRNIVVDGTGFGVRWTGAVGEFGCNDLFGNPSGQVAGNITMEGQISANPLFCDASGGDFSLQEGSPCLRRNNPCRVLIGALGAGGCVVPVRVTTWSSIKARFAR